MPEEDDDPVIVAYSDEEEEVDPIIIVAGTVTVSWSSLISTNSGIFSVSQSSSSGGG